MGRRLYVLRGKEIHNRALELIAKISNKLNIQFVFGYTNRLKDSVNIWIPASIKG